MPITAGQIATRSLTLTAQHVRTFAELTGDYNPLHFDAGFTARTKFGKLVVQGGLTTTMELVAAQRPFVSIPLASHFEQRFHVRHRLDRYGAMSWLDYADASPEVLADAIEKRTGKEARATVLGHIQRGGTPTAYDRVLATRFGVNAIKAVHEGAFGMMVALRGTDIVRAPLGEATKELKLVPPERYAEAEVFFG